MAPAFTPAILNIVFVANAVAAVIVKGLTIELLCTFAITQKPLDFLDIIAIAPAVLLHAVATSDGTVAVIMIPVPARKRAVALAVTEVGPGFLVVGDALAVTVGDIALVTLRLAYAPTPIERFAIKVPVAPAMVQGIQF